MTRGLVRTLACVGTLVPFAVIHGAEPAARERVVRPAAAPGPLDNPLKGWCHGAGNLMHQPYSLVFQRASWRELEPVEGDYQFDEWERHSWNRAEDRGKHIVFRVHIDDPGSPLGLPDWVKAKGVRLTPYQDHGGGLSPDYNHPAVVAGLEKLVAALGRRYDADPRIAAVQVGLLGFWGEWHTYPRTELFANDETQRRVIAAYQAAFPHKIVQARSGKGELGKAEGLGYHDDLFPEDVDGPEPWMFVPSLRAAHRDENWRKAMIGGELAFRSEDRWLGPEFTHTNAMIERGHFSFLGPYHPAVKANPAPQYRERCEQMVRRMGYEFTWTEIRHPEAVTRGGSLPVTLEGKNQGVAPFYYPWAVELALLDRRGTVAERLPLAVDLRTWQPGPFRVSVSPVCKALAGRYSLAIGIIDPWSGKPSIAFANDMKRREGWTILSEIEIKPTR